MQRTEVPGALKLPSREVMRPALRLALWLYASSLFGLLLSAGVLLFVSIENAPDPRLVGEIARYAASGCSAEADPVPCVLRLGPLVPGEVSLVTPDGRRHGEAPHASSVCDVASGAIGTVEICFRPPITASALLAALALAALSSLVLALVLTLRFVRPVLRLTAAAQAVSRGDLRTRTGLDQDDAFGYVGRAFDAMVDDLRELLDAEKELLASLSHELRTPLARLALALDLASDGVPLDEAALQGIRGDVRDLDELLSDLLDAARLQLTEGRAASPLGRVARVPVLARDWVSAAIGAARDRFPHNPFDLQIAEGADDAIVLGSERLLRRAVRNLLENAARVSPDGAIVAVRIEPAPDGVRVRVLDEGPGIDPAERDSLFEPFVRGRQSVSGQRVSGQSVSGQSVSGQSVTTARLGLGLTMVKRIIEGHGGSVALEPREGAGTSASIRLPTVHEPHGARRNR